MVMAPNRQFVISFNTKSFITSFHNLRRILLILTNLPTIITPILILILLISLFLDPSTLCINYKVRASPSQLSQPIVLNQY